MGIAQTIILGVVFISLGGCFIYSLISNKANK